MSTFISGSTVVEEIDGQRIVRNYTPSVQELTEETPEQVDKTPLTEGEVERLDFALGDTFQSPFSDSNVVQERAEVFTPPSDWVSPVVRQRRKQAMRLPALGQINDLAQRVANVVRFVNPPQSVVALAEEARAAINAARQTRESSQHPEARNYATSTAAKDDAVQAVAVATSAVRALEEEAAREEVREAWFVSLADGLDEKRADALEALRAAEKAYAELRGSINAAQALAIESMRWDKSWHSSTVSEIDLNAPIASMRAAINYLDGEDASDYTTGAFLTTDYDGIPPHTMAKLKRGADISDGQSFASQVYVRARSLMANDTAAQDAVRQKRLILLTNSNPLTVELLGKSADDE